MIFTRKDKRTSLEKEIDAVLAIMKLSAPSSKEYTAMTDNLVKLYKARDDEKSRGIKPDTIAVGVFGLAQVMLILYQEQFCIITSKAMNYVIKGRV